MAIDKFQEIIDKLIDIHKEFPDMKFGQVLQVSMDKFIKQKNIDLTNRSSKEILTNLNKFKEYHNKKRIKTSERSDINGK